MERDQTARQPRNIQQQERRASGGKGGKAGREGGERDTDGLAPGERRRRGRNRRHGSRQGAGRDQTDRKKEIYKYLRERRREKRRRDSQKRANMCIYISLNTVAWWLFIALSFIYIEGVYNIYLYI